MDNKDRKEGRENREVYENAVRAGKRTYFFDVRATRNKDYYLTITESKKRFHDDGSVSYQKHKIFLYKEDFEKFSDALKDSFAKIIELKKERDEDLNDQINDKFDDLDFHQLGDERDDE